MVDFPELKESDVQNWVGNTALQRGYRYYEDEAILNPRQRGSSLISECQGSQPKPYRVEIQLSHEGIAWGNCTCPGGDGGHCKHAAALLLMWIFEQQMFIEVPELEKVLENRSKADLISLIQQMVSRYPDLEQLLELSVFSNLPFGENIQPDFIAQQIRRAYSSAGGEFGDNARIAENLQPILDLGEDLLDREDVHNAATVYESLLEGMLSFEDCLLQDEAGDLGQVLAECEQGLQQCLENTQDAELRLGLLRSLFNLFVWDLQAGGLGHGDETPSILLNQATAEEKQQIAGWVQSEIPEGEEWEEDYQRRALGGLWLGLLNGQIDDETYQRICRQTGRTQDLIHRLLTLGRVDDALSAARSSGGYHITTTADLFEDHGYPELAVQLVKEQPNSEAEVRLLEWLKYYAMRHNQPEEALRLAESLFWQAQSLENFNALLEAASVLDMHEAVRNRMIQRLENAGNFSLLVEIQLLENNVDLALAALERVNPDIWWNRLSVLRRQVAQAVEAPLPHEAARQYLLLAEELIRQHNRGSYAEAARLLQQVRNLYRDLGQEDRWEQMIDSLRQGHRRLPDLMDELHRAGL
jgi:uncharacterized Zn finger protein